MWVFSVVGIADLGFATMKAVAAVIVVGHVMIIRHLLPRGRKPLVRARAT